MQAFNNDPALKAEKIAQLNGHIAADTLIRGTGDEDGRGCFIVCLFHNYDHSKFPSELGLPEWLGHLSDTLFENVTKGRHIQLGIEILDAIEPGVVIDDHHVLNRLHVFMQTRNLPRAKGYPHCEAAIEAVIELHERVIAVGTVSDAEWLAAAETAETAAGAARAARAAAWAAETAETAEYDAIADELIRLLKATGGKE